MCKQHPQCNLLVLLYQFPILLQYLDILQFRDQLLNLVSVVQMQLSLLNQLHNSNAGDHLRARCDPENIVECHILGAVDSSFARRMGEDLLAIFIDHYDAGPRNVRFGIGTCIINSLLQILNNALG
jgi:hypothetical protein